MTIPNTGRNLSTLAAGKLLVSRPLPVLHILACLLFPAVAAAQTTPFAGLAPSVKPSATPNLCTAGTSCRDAASPRTDDSVTTTYVPSPEVNGRVRQRVVAPLRQRNPDAAAKLEAALQQQDFREIWARAVASDGLHPNDVADAVASYWVLNWLIVHGQTDNTAIQVQGTRRQVVGALDANPAFRGLDDAGRQEMAEAMVYNFVLQYAAYQAATARHDPALLRALAEAAEVRMLQEANLDMRRLALTDDGLRPAAAAVPQPRPATPRATRTTAPIRWRTSSRKAVWASSTA